MSAWRVLAVNSEGPGRAAGSVQKREPVNAGRIAVRDGRRVLLIAADEIDWIEAADNYVCLHRGAETYVLRQTMNEVEARLPDSMFVRVHRSAIVNIDRIQELQPWFRGDYQVVLRDGTKLKLTKHHREKLGSRLLLGGFGR